MEHTLDKKSALNQGVTIFIYLTVLTLLEYGLAVALPSVPLLVVVALIKAGLVAYYYMHIYKLNQEDHAGGHEGYGYKTGTNRIGFWLFLLSDSFVFAGLLVSRINLLGLERPHLNQLLGLFVTSMLLISSFFMNRAETSIAHGDRKGFLNSTMVTMILGLAFFIGVVLIEWRTVAFIADPILHLFGEEPGLAPLRPYTNVFGGVFFMMTGMHAFHVLTGLIFLFIVWNLGRKGHFSAEQHWGVEAAAVYWHFVDVVWIFFYPALYLIGTIHG
jgi:cytochrome c oxidase subunit 3